MLDTTAQYELGLALRDELIKCQARVVQFRKQMDNPNSDEFNLITGRKLYIEEKECEQIETTISTLKRLGKIK